MIRGVRHVLLDIEGTTCPVSFVSEVLFPYAQRQLSNYLRQHGQEQSVQLLLLELLEGWQQEENAEAQALRLDLQAPVDGSFSAAGMSLGSAAMATVDPQALLPYLHWLIRRDRKVTAWKELQGRIWQEGYDRGDLKANLFSDVVPMLRRWKQAGMELSVYSSGSVAAQKLLYGHSQEGDLRGLFSHWFDTRVGAKQEIDSYQRILGQLGCAAQSVVFISDAVAELQAASATGMQTVFSDREGNPRRNPEGFLSISGFNQLVLHA